MCGFLVSASGGENVHCIAAAVEVVKVFVVL